jgi:acyl-CoA thioesterase-1
MRSIGFSIFLIVLMLVGVAVGSRASAASLNIVSMGASFTFGTGRGANYGTGVTNPPEAYPAQLEALLRQKGLDVSVKNACVPGDTTEQIFERLDSAVADGTQLVTLEPSY